MNSGARPSPGLMAIVIVCLTVLLGIGGTAAFTLWEQSTHGTGVDQPIESAPSATSSP